MYCSSWHPGLCSNGYRCLVNPTTTAAIKSPRFNTKVTLVVPVEYKWTSKDLQKKYREERNYKTCGVSVTNYFYDDREYSLARVRKSYKSGGNTYSCPKLNAESYAFCEYAKHKNVKGVRPIP